MIRYKKQLAVANWILKTSSHMDCDSVAWILIKNNILEFYPLWKATSRYNLILIYLFTWIDESVTWIGQKLSGWYLGRLGQF